MLLGADTMLIVGTVVDQVLLGPVCPCIVGSYLPVYYWVLSARVLLGPIYPCIVGSYLPVYCWVISTHVVLGHICPWYWLGPICP
jgi:hypothetical protein